MILRLLFLVSTLCIATPVQAKIYNTTVPPRRQDAYRTVHYRLWLPPGVKHLRGIIFRQHGCGPGARKLGREHANDIQWQALAAKWDCALMGSQMWAPKEDCSTWTMPADGSAHAFLTGLKKLAVMSRHPELEHVPWAIWGHSGGAIWVTNMTYRYPERILATFPRSGGLAPLGRKYARSQPAKPGSNPKAFDVPILFCYGEKEDQEKSRFYKLIRGVHQVYNFGRGKGAVWAMAAHPNSEHENSNSRLLALRFFDGVLKQRLPKTMETMKPISPLPLDREQGWLGDPQRGKIFPARKHRGDASRLAWLPDEVTAKAWLEFITKGTITDSTPPPAPTSLQQKVTKAGIELTWKAMADIESGIAAFEIYRDGRKIGTVQGTKVPRWNPKAHFHAWNYSDQPQPQKAEPEMKYLDRGKARSDTAEYRVVTVNQAGKKSPVSEPAK